MDPTMDNQLLLNESVFASLNASGANEGVLVEVRGRPPSSDHVILASVSQHQEPPGEFADINSLEFIDPRCPTTTSTFSYSNNKDDAIDLTDFMDIVTIKCRSCQFFCSTKSQLADHVRAQHRSVKLEAVDEGMKSYNVSEEQRQLISSLLALANDDQSGFQTKQSSYQETKSSESSHLHELMQTETLAKASTSPESSVYLCGECSMAFSSVAKCNEHVVTVHQASQILMNLPIKYEPINTATANQGSFMTQLDSPKKPTLESPRKIVRPIFPKLVENVETSPSAKRVRKTASRFADFVVEKSTLKLMPDNKRGGQQEETRCPIKGCQYMFNDSKLTVHVDCHVVEGEIETFRCFQCQTPFKNWRNCAMHLWASHQIDIDLLTCPECQTYKTIIPARLETHLQIHSDERTYACSVCKKRFKQLAQLKNHSVTHMDRDKDVVPMWYAKKLCNICDKYFADSKCLKKHVQAVHSKLKPYICQVCNHQSARKAMLEMHMRQHTGEKPYSCDICDYRTGDHNSLRRHKMRHLGVKPYNCPFCSYASIQCTAYKNHVQIKHPEEVASEANVFICSQCSYKTVNLDTFIGHQKSHAEKQAAADKVKMEKDVSDTSCSGSYSPPNEKCETEGSIFAEDAAEQGPSFNAPTSVTNKRISKSKNPKKNFDRKTISKTAKSQSTPIVEEDDSLHATTDLGGTTIPAEAN